MNINERHNELGFSFLVSKKLDTSAAKRDFPIYTFLVKFGGEFESTLLANKLYYTVANVTFKELLELSSIVLSMLEGLRVQGVNYTIFSDEAATPLEEMPSIDAEIQPEDIVIVDPDQQFRRAVRKPKGNGNG